MDTDTINGSEAHVAANQLEQIRLEDSADETKPLDGVSAGIAKEQADEVGEKDEDSDDELPPLVGPDDPKNERTDSEDDNPADPEPPTQEEADSIMISAASHKEEGNDHFKQGSLELAARSYRRGCQSIKRLLPRNQLYKNVDEQITSLHLALHTNLSMVLFQLKKHKQSIDVATTALSVQPNHVKALYRRAVARRALQDLDAAKADLLQALKHEPKNAACRKEFSAVQQELQAAKENEKLSLAKAFSGKLASGKATLYQDKEAGEEKKKELARQRKLKEQEQYKKRKQAWEDECVKRMAKNEPAISFDEWEKEQKELEKAKRKEVERKRKEEETKRKQALKAKRAAESKIDSDSDDEELTEKELAMMRGYKITKDGRKTSYFTRELPDETVKHYHHDIAPKRLNSSDSITSSPSPVSVAAATPSSSVASGSVTSAWNAAGTWEEKDTTTYCTDQLKKRLEETTVAGDKYDVDVVEVKSVSGHGSVAFAAGKKRYIFEYEAELKFEIKVPNNSQAIAAGTVRLPDIESTSHDELEVVFGSWKTKPSAAFQGVVEEAKKRFASELRQQVQRWVEDFNAAY